jgi:hypothetical protein
MIEVTEEKSEQSDYDDLSSDSSTDSVKMPVKQAMSRVSFNDRPTISSMVKAREALRFKISHEYDLKSASQSGWQTKRSFGMTSSRPDVLIESHPTRLMGTQ